jgi:acetyltransferase-like isoleucine patch superfamily enzyme
MTRPLVVGLGVALEAARSAIAAATLPRFATAADGLVIALPRDLSHPERIHIGSDVKIGPNSALKVQTHYPGTWLRHPEGRHVQQEFDSSLHIGDRVTATAGLRITVFGRVDIGDDVMFGPNVYISDGSHATERGDVPYKYQGITNVAPIRIGRGSWLGQNVVIMPGVTIGECVMVGANSVVRDDIPTGCIAVGAPARVVRRWDAVSDTWLRDSALPAGAEGVS